MTLVCAWCDTCLGEKAPLSNPGVTHGLCARCLSERLGPREETFHRMPSAPPMAAALAAPAY